MVTQTLTLSEHRHPNKDAEILYNELIGIDEHKADLLNTLSLLLNQCKIDEWQKKHHGKKISLLNHLDSGTPLVILSGDVGCGKTALAQTFATPLANILQQKVTVFETPSNIRGSGLVGEISNRITEAFTQAKAKLGKENTGILIIDEADDIATSRAQNQAHHEDRAGLNVLIKQIDSIRKEKINLAVILITNRIAVLDPAVRRRTTLHLKFERPDKDKLKLVFAHLFQDISVTPKEIASIISFAAEHPTPYSFSDLTQRVAKQAIYKAIQEDEPFSAALYKSVLEKTEPSPLIEEAKLN